jgi:hypothetical protein
MDGSKDQPHLTAGLDIGDKYSYLCLIDQHSGQVMEEGRLRTTPEAFLRRFASEQPSMRIAIEAGTHSPWASRVLEECGYEVLIANPRKTRLIYGQKRKSDKLDALRSWPASLGPIRNLCTRWSTGAVTPRLTWRQSIRARRWSVQSRPRDGEIFRISLAQVLDRELPQKGPRPATLRTRRGPGAHSRDRCLAHREDQGL